MVCNNKRFLFVSKFIKFRDYNETEPWLISFKTEAVEMEKLSFNKKYDKRRKGDIELIYFSFV
jgi:hypothetical protein